MKRQITFSDEAEFELNHGAATTGRALAFKSWSDAADPQERAFYQGLVERYDKLLAKYEAIRIADTSQDAEPEEAEDESDA